MYTLETRNDLGLHYESFRAPPGRILAGKTGAKHPKDCQLTFQKGKKKKFPVYNTSKGNFEHEPHSQ